MDGERCPVCQGQGTVRISNNGSSACAITDCQNCQGAGFVPMTPFFAARLPYSFDAAMTGAN